MNKYWTKNRFQGCIHEGQFFSTILSQVVIILLESYNRGKAKIQKLENFFQFLKQDLCAFILNKHQHTQDCKIM